MIVAIIGSARCFASDTITANSAISGGRTVVSTGGSFELGFFRPAAAGGDSNTASSHNYYVGIWYKKAVTPCTPVWVANRATPVSDPASSQLNVAPDSNLVLTNEVGELVWSSNVVISGSSSNGTVAVLLDSGNLVLRRDDGEVVWQSIEHPTDTWLPGARLGMNKITGHVQALTSWRSSSDPAPGMYSLGIDPHGTSQFFLSWNRTVNYWSSGEWTGSIFAGLPEMTRQVQLRVRGHLERQLLRLLPARSHGHLQVSRGRLRPGEADHVAAVRRRVDGHMGGAAQALRRLRHLRRVRHLRREERATM